MQLNVSAQGWLQLASNGQVAAQFKVDQHAISIYPSATGEALPEGCPQQIPLIDVVGVDAIGEPIEAIETVEIELADNTTMLFGWSLDFCKEVITALMQSTRDTESTEQPDAATTGAETPPSTQRSTDGDTTSSPAVAQLDGASRRSSSVLDIEEVVYLGGYPNFNRKKKKVAATFSPQSITVRLSDSEEIEVAWTDVKTIEIQNSDEARFRMNLKIHRNSSAVIIDCGDNVALRLEARDCPTIALRNAITELLAHQPVVVV